MKKFASLLLLLCSVIFAGNTQEVDYNPFSYQGFNMEIPAGTSAEMTAKEAMLKNPEMKIGLSIKLEKDAKASLKRAAALTDAMVKDLDLKNAQLSTTQVAGLSGYRADGELEGAQVTVIILDAGSSYLKIVAISDASSAPVLQHIISSITR